MTPIPPLSFTTILALASLCVATTGCLTPKAPLDVEVPRKFQGTSTMKTIAILPFEGRHATQTRDKFEAMLEDTEVEGEQFFTVAEGRKLENARKELARIQSGQFSLSDLKHLQLQSGATGIATGKILEASIKDTLFTEKRARCEEKENTWRGVLLRKCEDGMLADVDVTCTRREARFTFLPRLLSTQTGRLVFVDRYSRSVDHSHCEGDRGSLAETSELVDEVVDLIMLDIQEDITPQMQTVKVPLKKLSKKSGATKEQGEKFESAIAFAKADRLDRACEIWQELRGEGLDGLSIRYNVALCTEHAGNLEKSLAILTETDRMLARPDEQVNDYLRRIRTRIRKRDEVAQIFDGLMDRQAGMESRPPKQNRRKALQSVQLQLNHMGYDCGTADGKMGPKTQSCIGQYQRKQQLTISGDLTEELLLNLGIQVPRSTAPARMRR